MKNYQCRRKTKDLCYKALVRPQMEYASIIWDTYNEQRSQPRDGSTKDGQICFWRLPFNQ